MTETAVLDAIVTPVEAPAKPKFEDLFAEVEIDSETKGLDFPWFTQVVTIEPGEPLDIPQPVMSGWVAIAIHKPHQMPRGLGERRSTGYLFDYDDRASAIYNFDGEKVDGFRPKQNHQGYTVYFLELHTYDPESISWSSRKRLDAMQIKQAGLIPKDLSENEEDALAKGKDAPKGLYQRAARSVVTFKPDERAELMGNIFAFKLNISAGLEHDAIELIEGLRRSGKYISILMDKITKFEEVPEDPKATDSDDAPSE